MNKNLLSLFFIVSIAGISAAQTAPDFDSSLKTVPFEFKASLAGVKTPEVKAPVVVESYTISRMADNSPYAWHKEAEIRADGKALEERLKAAGYAVTPGEVVKRSWGQGSFDYNWEYSVTYAPPPGYAAGAIKNYRLWRDADSSTYDWSEEYKIKDDGKAIEASLTAAGYVIIYRKLSRRQGQGSSENFEYDIDYLAPAGRASAEIQDYFLMSDAGNALYGWTKESAIKADGKAIEERLKAAGYIVISGRLSWKIWGQASDQYSYEYNIEYLPPVGYAAGERQIYEILRDEENKPYDWSGEYKLNTAGKAMEEKLKAAGNVILRSQEYMTQWGLRYYIWYVMPIGGTAADILYYELWKGRDGQFYTGWSGKSQAETDGKGVAENLKAAGYVILEGKVVQAMNEDRWGYAIRYVRPVI